MRRTWLTYCFLLLSAWATAQVKIGGVIRNEQGAPIELATVRLEGTTIGTVTDLKGRYSLKFMPQDSVTVVFSMLGYQSRKRLLVSPQGNISLNMTLTPIDFELSEVTISERRRQTSTIQQLDANTMQLAPDASGGGIEGLLTTQAGVSSNNELSHQYNVRGGSFDENMVYVNGIEIYRPFLISSAEQEGLSFVNPDMIHSINFSTGGYGAEYGDKMSSVLDITYKKIHSVEAKASLSLQGASVYAGWGNKQWSWTHAFRYKTSRTLLTTLDTQGEYDPHFADYQTYLSWQPNKQWEAGIIANITRNSYNFRPQDRITKYGTLSDIRHFKVYFDGQEQDQFNTYFGSGYLTRHINNQNNITLRVSAFSTQERETYDITGQYWLGQADDDATDTPENSSIGTYMEHARNYLKANVYALSLQGNHRIERHKILWGAEVKHERIQDRLREWELRDSAGYSMPQLAPEGPTLTYSLTAQNAISNIRSSFYIQDNFKFQSVLGLFTLSAGIRASYWTWNKEFIVSPRATLSLIPERNDRFTLRIAAGIYHQAPFYKELRDTIGSTATLNRHIKSPRAIHFVAGGDYHFHLWNRPFRLTTELYYKHMSDLIPYNVDNLRLTYYGHNLAKGYAAGVDVKLFGEFVPGTDSWLSLSFMKTEEKINNQWTPRPTDQRYRISLYLTDYFPGSSRWKMNLKATLADGLPFGPPHSGRETHLFRTPPYRRVDIGMSYSLINPKKVQTRRTLKGLWIGIDALNLLNTSNVSSYYWVTTSENHQYAVPNYLTTRQFNFRLQAEF